MIMRVKNLDLIAAMLIAATNIILILLAAYPPEVIVIVTLPQVVILPGYTLIAALFPKNSLRASERFLFSLGMSLTLTIVGGFLLNLFPTGLQRTSWGAYLGLLTLVCASIGIVRRHRISATQHPAIPVASFEKFRPTFYQSVLFGLSTLIVVCAFLYNTVGAIQQPYPAFTQLWLLPQIHPEQSCSVQMGVKNFEPTTLSYRIVMTLNGAQIAPWSAIILKPQATWQQVIPIDPGSSENVSISVHLYRLDQPGAIYRQAHVTLSHLWTGIHGNVPICNPPGASSNSLLAIAYKGTISSMDSQFTIPTFLSITQQHDSSFVGYFTTPTQDGSLQGLVLLMNRIQFTITNQAMQKTLSFEGVINTQKGLVGSYCKVNASGTCLSSRGTWSVIPTS